MKIHATAAAGFTKPDIYEQGRPGYPSGAVDILALREGMRVVDLGCGTGKLTRQLVLTDAEVIGVEPLEGMLATFHDLLPDVPILNGTAEEIPLPDSSVDVVTCASAFHWFDHDRAIPEIRRVLKAGGRLAIIWNRRDSLEGWAAEFWNITEAFRGETPGYRTGAWRSALDASPLFGPITEHPFAHTQTTDLDGLLARIESISFIETLPEKTKADVLAEARAFIASHPETRDRTTFAMPYRTVVYVAEAV
ncbi:MAG: class I SAM-dependent methyltransferase [Actinomycetota bacterium]